MWVEPGAPVGVEMLVNPFHPRGDRHGKILD